MTENRTDVAREVINKGFNSLLVDTEWSKIYEASDSTHRLYRPHVFRTLAQLAQADDTRSQDTLPYYDDFVSYFDDDSDYGLSIITKAVAKASPYSASTPSKEILGAIMETLHLIVSQQAALEQIYTAVSICKPSTNIPELSQSMLKLWDQGSALLIGSIERGGDEVAANERKIDGQFMFSIIKRNCDDFGVCPTLVPAFITTLNQGQNATHHGDCESLKSSADTIQGMLQASLIQSLMIYALDNEQNNHRAARGYIAALSLLPIFASVDIDTASILELEMIYSDNPATKTNSQTVFSSVFELLPQLPLVNCEWIGSVNSGAMKFCSSSSSGTITSSETRSNPGDASSSGPLLDYIPTTNIDYILGFSNDLRDMNNATSAEEAKGIFINGKNAWHMDDQSKVYPLADLSSSAFEKMKYEPVYNMYTYTLKDLPIIFDDDGSVSDFGKTTVLKVFEELTGYYGDELDDHVASGAAKVLIIFNEIIHVLNEAAIFCEQGSTSLVPNAVDAAVAFYVGRDQVKGSASQGYSIYNLAERAADKFTTFNMEQEAISNQRVMDAFKQLQEQVINPTMCNSKPREAANLIRIHANEILVAILTTYTQGLIYSLKENKLAIAEIFAIALSPFIAMCDYKRFQEFRDEMISNSSPPDFDRVLGQMQDSYNCLGISCPDVGTLTADGGITVPACTFAFKAANQQMYSTVKQVDRFVNDRYVTMTDQTEYGMILDDIRDVVNANDTSAAKEVFENGHNAQDAHGTMTLSGLNDVQETQPSQPYTILEKWLGRISALDPDADEIAQKFGSQIVTHIFEELLSDYGDTKDDDMAGEAVILTIVSTQVWYYLDQAVKECQNPIKLNLLQTAEYVDRAAMLYIGQDQTFGSSETGYSFYRLAEYAADFFGTMTDDGEAKVNDAVLSAFDTIKQSFLLSNDCIEKPNIASKSMRFQTNEIVNQMKTTMLQGMIMYASNDNTDYAEIYALMIAPFVALCDETLAQDIQTEFIQSGQNRRLQARAGVEFQDISHLGAHETPLTEEQIKTLSSQNNISKESSHVASVMQTTVPAVTNKPLSTFVSRLQQKYMCMHISCANVGEYTGDTSLPKCSSNAQSSALPAKASANKNCLAGYCPTYNQNFLDYVLGFSLDLRDMAIADDSMEAKRIFNQGQNAFETGNLKSLSQLSSNAGDKMKNEFYYNVFRFALKDVQPLNNEDSNLSEFGKTIVLDVLDELNGYYGNEMDDNMAAEAVKLHIILQDVIHLLYLAVNSCATGDLTVVRQSIDTAVALYVGSDQLVGDANTGYSLYNLAEKMSLLFGTTSMQSTQSEVNQFIITAFKQIQTHYVSDNYCKTPSINEAQIILTLAHGIINKIKVVVIQGFIHYMYAEDKEYAELYGLVVSPLLSVCNYAQSQLLEQLIIQQEYDISYFSDILQMLQDNYSCMGVACEDIGTYGSNLVDECNLYFDESAQPYTTSMRVDPLLGSDVYFTLTDQTEFGLVLDDIRDIVNATSVADAKNVFLNGKNDPTPGSLTISTMSTRADSDMSDERYMNMFESWLSRVSSLKTSDGKAESYGSQIVSDIFDELDSYYGDNRDVKLASEAIILVIVSMEVWHLLAQAVHACENISDGSIDDVASAMDKAAMLYIGMDQSFGSNSTGYSFYRLAEYTADFFGTRSLDGQSNVNRDIINAFDNIKQDYLMSGYCASDPTTAMNELMVQAEYIINKMKATMIQGFFMYAVNGDKDYAELYALQISPLLSECDANLAQSVLDDYVINKNDIETKQVYDIGAQYSCLGISCEDVGALKSDKNFPECIDSNIVLLGYQTTTSVGYLLGFTEDVRDMLNSASVDEAKEIFVKGKNSIYDGIPRPLSYLSTDAINKMSNEPYFNLFMYALRDVMPLTSDGKSIAEFGQTVVLKVFEELDYYYPDSEDDNMAAASVILHIFTMDIIHSLYAAANHCDAGESGMVAKALDDAVTLYVGADQLEGDTTTGYSLYHIAEKLSRRFDGTLNDKGQSKLNVAVMHKFKELKASFGTNDVCDKNPQESSLRLLDGAHFIINKIKAVMLQGMYHFMYDDDMDKAELFAISVVPFVAACNAELSYDLLEKMIIKSIDFESNLYDDVVERIQYVYSCMGVSCEDVGSLPESNADACDFEFDMSYQPFKKVLKVEQFLDNRYYTLTDQSTFGDLLDDIRDIVYADSVSDAQTIFVSGKNALNGEDGPVTLASLSQEANTRMSDERYFVTFKTELAKVPAIGSINAAQYGYAVVNDIFDELASDYGTGKDDSLAGEAIILMIVSMEIWHYLAQAVKACSDDPLTTDTVAEAIDRAAMLYIGQDQEFGSDLTGYSFYRLAEYLGKDFTTESDDGESNANSFIIDAFDSLKYKYVLNDSCVSAPLTASYSLMDDVEEIINQMKVTMIQGFIKYAVSGNADFAEVYALQIAPIMSLCPESPDDQILNDFVINSKAGRRDLQTSFSTPNTASVISGASDEASKALKDVLSELQDAYECMGISCTDIGSYSADFISVDGCREPTKENPAILGGYSPKTDQYQGYMNLTLDLEAIRNSNDSEEAQQLYEKGLNAVDDDGSIMSLASMNQDFDWEMSTQPFFNFFKYSLSRIGPIAGDGNDVSDYAHTIIEDVFEELSSSIGSQKDVELAADAILATHFWMQVAHFLYDAVEACESKDTQAISSALDRAAAVYAGADSETDAGYALYGLVQDMANTFGTNDKDGESKVHQEIINLLNTIQDQNVMQEQCANAADDASLAIVVSRLQAKANQIISYLTIPILQKLLFYLINNDAHYVELYALQLTPLLATCDENAAVELQDILIMSRSGYKSEQYDTVMQYLMPAIVKCMDISCSDVGSYQDFTCSQPVYSQIAGVAVDATNISVCIRLLRLNFILSLC